MKCCYKVIVVTAILIAGSSFSIASQAAKGATGAVHQMHQAAATPGKPHTAEQEFKNVQVLKGITVDDFLGTMGIMSAALGFDCSECHVGDRKSVV